MKKTVIVKALLLFSIFNSCNYSYDHDLMNPDGHHGGYNLTPLGRLVNGPWTVDEFSMDSFNTTLFLNDSEVSSKASPYTEIQKDLVFELHKNGTIIYWLKSEIGSTVDTNVHEETTTITQKHLSSEQLNKVYTTGYWKANFIDSSVFIHFENKKVSDLHFKFLHLNSSSADFQQTSFFDSLYNGNKVTMKKVNTLHYTILYPTL